MNSNHLSMYSILGEHDWWWLFASEYAFTRLPMILREEKMNFIINLITNLVQCSKANDLDPEPISPENGLFYVLVDTLFSKWQEILHKKVCIRNFLASFNNGLLQRMQGQNLKKTWKPNLGTLHVSCNLPLRL